MTKALASRARIGPIVRISVENEKQRPGFGRFYRVITILKGQIIAIPRKTTRPAVRSFLTFTVYRQSCFSFACFSPRQVPIEAVHWILMVRPDTLVRR